MKKVKIYSDGSAKSNPNGPGGYGTIMLYLNDKNEITGVEEFTAGFQSTTNNRMELMGVIIGVESLESPHEIEVYSDSSYVVNAFNQNWIKNWLSNNWLTSTNNPVKNKDLWERLLIAQKPHKINYNWVKGHANDKYNIRCDYLATSSADGKKLVKGKDGIYYEERSDE